MAGHSKKVDKAFLANVKATLALSMRKLAKELNVSLPIVKKAIKELGALLYVRSEREWLSKKTTMDRVIRGKKLINQLKKKDLSTVLILRQEELDCGPGQERKEHPALDLPRRPPTHLPGKVPSLSYDVMSGDIRQKEDALTLVP